MLKDRLSEHAKAHEAKVKDLNAQKEKELAEERRLADIMGKSMAREAAISAKQDILSQQSAAKAHEESMLQMRARESGMKLLVLLYFNSRPSAIFVQLFCVCFA